MKVPSLPVLKQLLTAFLLLGASAAHAECYGTPGDSGSCYDVKITLLYIDVSTDAYISISGNVSLLSCAPSGNLLKLAGTSANFKAVYATLAAAHLSSRPINIRLAPGIQQCTIAYVTMP